MSKLVYALRDLPLKEGFVVGGKARSLGSLIRNKIMVPSGSVVTGEAYDVYIEKTGLQGKIILELTRKSFEDMRWEELWDTSQRILNIFNKKRSQMKSGQGYPRN